VVAALDAVDRVDLTVVVCVVPPQPPRAVAAATHPTMQPRLGIGGYSQHRNRAVNPSRVGATAARLERRFAA
jgi:hypothetical protein